MKFAPVEPGVEPPQRAAVGAAGVLADRGLDQAARGRRGRPESLPDRCLALYLQYDQKTDR